MNLISKYNVPVPRYTSYPTVPAWNSTPSQAQWKQLVKDCFTASNSKEGISVYIHLPFCESLCTYCACNTRITVNHKVEEPYLEAVLKEWQMYLQLFNERPRIRELHLGGGTPTFFSPQNLSKLLKGVLEPAILMPGADLSFEGHPANTTRQHLQTLYDLGFRRVSYGIQDFDPVVQDVIHRYQSVEQVTEVVNAAREIGYTSVNFDLVYGLPKQNRQTLEHTFEKVLKLRPDRVAFYSYAHVPWMRPGQRKFTEKDLPEDREKRELYELGKRALIDSGYQDVGLDHFALPGDDLLHAKTEKRLHRNFMGYTTGRTELMVSLGCSAISDTWNGFMQNIKAVEPYQEAIARGEFAIQKGHVLTVTEQLTRRIILEIMCFGETCITHEHLLHGDIREGVNRLLALKQDNLLVLEEGMLRVTSNGEPFLRNIAGCFDKHLNAVQAGQQVFSKAI